MGMRLDLHQIVYVLSDALDLVCVDDVQHGKRVAYMAVRTAKKAELDKGAVDDVLRAGLLHDCGVSSTIESRKIMGGPGSEHSDDHCVRGRDMLAGFRPLAHLAPIVYHHDHRWDALERMGLPLPLALRTNCIYLADGADAFYRASAGQNILLARDKIRRGIERRRGSHFAPRLVDAFLKVSAAESFWLALDPRPLRSYLDAEVRRHGAVTIELDELMQLAGLFARIVDAKSPFTAEHSHGVARVARLLAELDGFSEEQCDLVQVAGLLHDLGKLVVPDAILEKPGPLDDDERATMMTHTFYTRQILNRIEGFEEIAEWAAFHHEALAGDGYPFRRDRANLSREARIMAVADVFQALAQARPYRPPVPPEKHRSIVADMVTAGKLDGDVVALAQANFTDCIAAAVGAKAAA